MSVPDFVYNILRTLRTSSIAAIVERLRPLLHIDPVAVLPPEIMSEIFSYLTPSMLLEASRASRSWRESTLDSRLWRQKFNLEGWGLNMNEVQNFEQQYSKPRKQMKPPVTDHRSQKKRSRAEVDGSDDGVTSRQPRIASVHHDGHQAWHAECETPLSEENMRAFQLTSLLDDKMEDAEPNTVTALLDRGPTIKKESHELWQTGRASVSGEEIERSSETNKTHQSLDHPYEMETQEESDSHRSLMTQTFSGQSRLNYHHIFKQKRKLEDNWNAGSYQSFQLPHRDHPEEAHGECVYTIQYIGNYLVSGSRDRTLRIWDLETQRLVREPLTGHTGSVLCLQFDNRPKEDIIISGSSDTDVILWRFSTGKMLKKITQAHRESVLNLKFDERFLVTCSKDKTVKIWSRHELQPGDADYPVKGMPRGGKCPSYILDLRDCGGPQNIETYFTPEQRQPLKPYTPLMLIDSHGAAVNAIHIHHDHLVSASGDRAVKVFNIHTGECVATCKGHTKGIACVQYDGKRIVSGSSDNTIRIYDPATEAEVACLQGHTKLVRTIQSAFGDVPGSHEQLESEAKQVDKYYIDAISSGLPPPGSARSGERNSGSRDPNKVMAYGAKLPPGGGGSRWGRIISGSYDETIIIWKKAADGRWVIGHRLRQEEALRAAGGPLLSRSDLQSQLEQPQPPTHPNPPPRNQALNWLNQPQAHVSSPGASASAAVHPNPQSALRTGAAVLQTGFQAATNGNQSSNSPYQNLITPALQAQIQAYQQQLQQQLQQHTAHQQQMLAATVSNIVANSNLPPIAAVNSSHLAPYGHQSAAEPASGTHDATPPTSAQTIGVPPSLPTNHPPTLIPQPNARVFKLQFDARRIICCSQDPKIVGWDFANGDEGIIKCSRFFASPQ